MRYRAAKNWYLFTIWLQVVLCSLLFDTAWQVSVFGVILVRIFLHSDWIRRDTPYLSVSSPNAGKYGPEQLRIWTLFAQCESKRFCLRDLQLPFHSQFYSWCGTCLMKKGFQGDVNLYLRKKCYLFQNWWYITTMHTLRLGSKLILFLS